MSERIYVQTNDAERNEIVAFDRSADGRLERLGTFDTGGRGTGKPHLASQSSIVLNGEGTLLLVANAGSDEISLFTVEPDGLLLVAQAPSGGSTPTSIAVHGELAYVLNNGQPGITGFSLSNGGLAPIEGSSAAARPRRRSRADRLQPQRSHDRHHRARHQSASARSPSTTAATRTGRPRSRRRARLPMASTSHRTP